MTMAIEQGLGVRDLGLEEGLEEGLGKIVNRPTVTGWRFSCDRRAQSSSGTSTGATRKRAASANRAASRSSAVEKKTRTDSSRSSTAAGEKSSTIASIRSARSQQTSRAGYVLCI